MKEIILTEEEMNNAREINGKLFTVIIRQVENSFEVSAIWANNKKLVTNWSKIKVNYFYEAREQSLKLMKKILDNSNNLRGKNNGQLSSRGGGFRRFSFYKKRKSNE